MQVCLGARSDTGAPRRHQHATGQSTHSNDLICRAMGISGMIHPNRACMTDTGEIVDTGARTLSSTWVFGFVACRHVYLYLYYVCPCVDTSACVSAHRPRHVCSTVCCAELPRISQDAKTNMGVCTHLAYCNVKELIVQVLECATDMIGMHVGHMLHS